MNFNQIIDQFRAEILSNGITPPDEIIDDAKIHRFYIQGDKPRTKNGWYIFFRGNITCGVFGNWKEGKTHKWCAKAHGHMSNGEYAEYLKQLTEARRQRDRERLLEQEKSAQEAIRIWNSSDVADPKHPYLVRKRIDPFYARQRGKNLLRNHSPQSAPAVRNVVMKPLQH